VIEASAEEDRSHSSMVPRGLGSEFVPLGEGEGEGFLENPNFTELRRK